MKPEGKHHEPEWDRCDMVHGQVEEEGFGENPKVSTYAREWKAEVYHVLIGEISKDHTDAGSVLQ